MILSDSVAEWLYERWGINPPAWLFRSWWAYVLEDTGNPDYGPCRGYIIRGPLTDRSWPPGRWINWLSRFLCRWRGHRPGPIYFNAGGLEPDMRCRGCGHDLG